MRTFISYSESDRHLVKPVVDTLRLLDPTAFFACESISPGDDWREEIRGAIELCDLFFLFWCGHSAESHWVLEEYRLASAKQKRIVPCFLDDTPVPEFLDRYHGIDFREAAGHDGGESNARPKLLLNIPANIKRQAQQDVDHNLREDSRNLNALRRRRLHRDNGRSRTQSKNRHTDVAVPCDIEGLDAVKLTSSVLAAIRYFDTAVSSPSVP